MTYSQHSARLVRLSTPGVRDGFALMATLWIIVAVGAVALAITQSAHLLGGSARNRSYERSATWRALGCLARVRARLDDELSSTERPLDEWDSLDVYVTHEDPGCRISARAAGVTLDINRATGIAIRSTLAGSGIDAVRIDSIVWLTPSSGHRPYASSEEMLSVANGIMHRTGADTLLGIDTGHVNLRSPRAVQLGVMSEYLGQKTGTESINTPTPPGAFDNVTSSAQAAPEAWWLRVEASDGYPPVTVRAEERMVRLGRSIGVSDIRL